MKSLSLSTPHVIAMVGLPGSGKSEFAEKFAATFRAPCISLSRLEQIIDATPSATRDIMEYQLDELLKTRQSIILDGGTEARVDRTDLVKRAQKAGYDTLFVWVQIDEPSARYRATKASRARQTPVLTQEEFDRRAKRFTPPNQAERPIVISGKHTYASQAKVVLRKLSAPRAEVSSQTKPPTRGESQSSGRRSITIG